jgi:hypothetical protein
VTVTVPCHFCNGPFDESYVCTFMMKAQKNDSELKRALTGLKATYNVRADPENHDVNLDIRLEKP